jgi:hypothetical protein
VADTILYDVRDAKVYGITDEGSETVAPTYADGVDVPGIRTVGLSPTITSNSLKGDGRTLDKRSKLDAVALTFGYAKLAPAVLAVVDGGTSVTTGEGATLKSEYRRTALDQIPYFGFAAQVTEVDGAGGSAILVVARCKIEDGTLFGAESESYAEPEFSAEGIYTEHGFLWKARYARTAETLPTDLADLLTDLTA